MIACRHSVATISPSAKQHTRSFAHLIQEAEMVELDRVLSEAVAKQDVPF
jgi:hypothetical protein